MNGYLCTWLTQRTQRVTLDGEYVYAASGYLRALSLALYTVPTLH